MSQEARRNMDYMTEIMLQCGFVKYEYEWWHFNDEDCFDYPVTDHVYTEFLFNNKTE
jgi:D-alanyl-D-alanine dipeptidase